jgi:two-component system, sensor histidine kinase YesM
MDPAQENHKGEMRSIGLKNVNDRIQYICGNDFGLTIESELGKYTKIIFTLPKSM